MKYGLTLTAIGDLDGRFYRGNDPKIFNLDLDGVFVRIAGHRVNVQFQTVDAGLLDLLGEFNPSAFGVTIETRNDGHPDRQLGTTQMFQIVLRINSEIFRVRKIGERFGEAFSSLVELGKKVALSVVKLFFEKGVEHDGGGARVLPNQNRR